MMDILMPETCWAHKKWNKIASDIKLVFYSSTKLQVFAELEGFVCSVVKDTCTMICQSRFGVVQF